MVSFSGHWSFSHILFIFFRKYSLNFKVTLWTHFFFRSSSSERTPSSQRQSDLFDSFQSLRLKTSPQRKVSPAMSSLLGYYGLSPTDGKSASEGFEMAVYRKEGAHYLEDGPFSRPSGVSPPPRLHRKSRSIANDLMSENGNLGDNLEAGDSDKWMEKLLVRRRQKSEADFTSRTPEMLLKEETANGCGFSAITCKGLALRPKSAARTVSGFDPETGSPNLPPVGLGDSFGTDSINGVRKSPSTSSLQDSDNSPLASLWPLSLKPDLQAFSTAAITKPIFDGLPKPITGRKTKAALD